MWTSMNLESLYRKVLDIGHQHYEDSKHDESMDLFRIVDLYDSVNHNQIESKLWLMDEAGHLLDDEDKMCIVGSWYGVLSYMIRHESKCLIDNCDLDPYTKVIGERLVADLNPQPSWYLMDGVERYLENKDWYTILCTTSSEHIPPDRFFEMMKARPDDTLVIAQSNNNQSELEHINIHETSDELAEQCMLNDVYYNESREFTGKEGPYLRHMVIGK